jgi:hypothetical protein
VQLSGRELEFVSTHSSAAMITVGDDGFAKASRVAVGVIDGKLWSSGTRSRARTKRLARDPRCTLYVHASKFSYLTLETTVTIRDDDDVAVDSMRFFRMLQRKPDGPLDWFGGTLTDEQFVETMTTEGRVLYEFDVQRTYGLF